MKKQNDELDFFLLGTNHISKVDTEEGITQIGKHHIIALEIDRWRLDSLYHIQRSFVGLYYQIRLLFKRQRYNPLRVWYDYAKSEGKEIYLIDEIAENKTFKDVVVDIKNGGEWILNERDRNMADALIEIAKFSQGKTILWLGGAGHVGGMEEILKEHGYNAEGWITEDGDKIIRRMTKK